MGQQRDVEITKTDQATLLARLADDLRGCGLALMGLAHQEGDRIDPQFRTLAGLSGSLEEVATVLDAVAVRLCAACRIGEVTGKYIFPATRHRPPRKG